MASDVAAAVKAHAEAAGMEVSAYMIAAAVAQMARDDAATGAFAALDAGDQAAEEQAAGIPAAEWPSFAALTAEERALVRRVLGTMATFRLGQAGHLQGSADART